MRDDLIVGLLLFDLLPRKLFLEIFEGKVDRNALRQVFLILEKKLPEVIFLSIFRTSFFFVDTTLTGAPREGSRGGKKKFFAIFHIITLSIYDSFLGII